MGMWGRETRHRKTGLTAVQSHICTRWMRLLGGWKSGFSASLDGCAPGLPGQDARQWGSWSGFNLSQGPEERDRPGPTRHQSHLWLAMTEMKEADKVPFLHAPVSSGSLFWPAEKGFAERFTEAQKSSQAMRHFLPKRTSSSSASSRPRPAPTQHTAKPTPTTPEPQPPEGAHARHDATPSRNAKDLSPRSLWILRLRNPPEQPGRKKRGPSLATTGPPSKQPLLYLSPPRLTLSAEDRVLKSSTQRWWICWKKEP